MIYRFHNHEFLLDVEGAGSRYLDCMANALSRTDARLFAYCLMSSGETGDGSTVAGADVVCECDDLDGSLRRASGTTDEDGAAWIRVVAPSRDCPEDAGLMSSYFSRCVLTANRDDFQDGSFTLSGQDIDRLDDPDQGGHKVAVRIVLQPE